MNCNKLLKALDDESNDILLNFTTEKIIEMNLKILNELALTKKETDDMMRKLRDYIYVDEMNDLKYGSYIRWIPIEDPENINLSKVSIFSILYLLAKRAQFFDRNLDENMYLTLILFSLAALICSSTILPDPIIDKVIIIIR